MTIFGPFWLKMGYFMRFCLDFSETLLCEDLGFFALHSVQQDASFELSKHFLNNF